MNINEERKPTFQDLWVVSQAAAYLTNQACTISARNINDGIVRLQFNREVAYYARSIVRDVEEGRKTIDQGLKEIKQEFTYDSDFQINCNLVLRNEVVTKKL